MSPVKRTHRTIADRLERYLPAPFTWLAALLLGVGVVAVAATPSGPVEVIEAFSSGLWSLNSFAFQMILILVLGHVVAAHPIVHEGLRRLAAVPSSPRQAVVLVGFVAMLLAWLNWGLGLIGGALLAREVGAEAARRGRRWPYAPIVAAGYLGLGSTWHFGLSGSAPLSAAADTASANPFLAELGGPLSTSLTIFSPTWIGMSVASMVVGCGVLAILVPTRPAVDDLPAPVTALPARAAKDARRIHGRRWVGLVLVFFLAAAALVELRNLVAGTSLTLDRVNLVFLAVATVLFMRPDRLESAFREAFPSAAAIALQFPLYAGVMGMMKGTGLSALLTDGVISVSSATTLPLLTYLGAGAVNLAVPSGGGQWAVMGSSLLQAGAAHGVAPSTVLLAFAAGDQWTNLLQPFWALPLLGICRIPARRVFSWTALVMVISGLVTSIILLAIGVMN